MSILVIASSLLGSGSTVRPVVSLLRKVWDFKTEGLERSSEVFRSLLLGLRIIGLDRCWM
jgi:hypothetical protein